MKDTTRFWTVSLTIALVLALGTSGQLLAQQNGNPAGTANLSTSAHNSGGQPAASPAASATTPEETQVNVPGAPTNVSASNDTEPPDVLTTWRTAPGAVTGYYVYRDGTRIATLGDTIRSHTDYATDWDTTYSYTVSAYNSAGEGTAGSDSVTTRLEPPNIPTNVSASNVTTSPPDVFITWEAASGTVAGYHVYRDGARIATLDSTIRSYTDTGTAYETEHRYGVSGYNSDATGEPGQSDIVTTPAQEVDPGGVPGAPTRVSASNAAEPPDALIAWGAPSGTVTGYYVYRDGARISTEDASSRSHTDYTTGCDTTYRYTASAYNSAGEGQTGSDSLVTTPPEPPGPPTNVSASNIAGSPPDALITWRTASGTVTGYYLYRDGARISTESASSRSYTDTGTDHDATHHYRVSAYNPGGEGTAEFGNVTTPAEEVDPEGPPGAPTNVNASNDAEPPDVFITWRAASGTVAGYYVYRDGTRTATLDSTIQSHTDYTTSWDTAYRYTVSAYNSEGEGHTGSDSLVTTPPEPPGRPTNVAASNIAGSPPDVLIAWTAPNGTVTGYYVYRDGARISTEDASTRSYTDTGAAHDTTHHYRISAYNSGGEGAAGPTDVTTPEGAHQ